MLQCKKGVELDIVHNYSIHGLRFEPEKDGNCTQACDMNVMLNDTTQQTRRLRIRPWIQGSVSSRTSLARASKTIACAL